MNRPTLADTLPEGPLNDEQIEELDASPIAGYRGAGGWTQAIMPTDEGAYGLDWHKREQRWFTFTAESIHQARDALADRRQRYVFYEDEEKELEEVREDMAINLARNSELSTREIAMSVGRSEAWVSMKVAESE